MQNRKTEKKYSLLWCTFVWEQSARVDALHTAKQRRSRLPLGLVHIHVTVQVDAAHAAVVAIAARRRAVVRCASRQSRKRLWHRVSKQSCQRRSRFLDALLTRDASGDDDAIERRMVLERCACAFASSWCRHRGGRGGSDGRQRRSSCGITEIGNDAWSQGQRDAQRVREGSHGERHRHLSSFPPCHQRRRRR